MSSKVQKYEQTAAGAGLKFDAVKNVIYGQKNGFEVVICAENPSYPFLFTVSLSAKSQAGFLSKEDTKMFIKGEAAVTSLNQQGNLIKMVLKATKNVEKMCNNINSSIGALTAFLKGKGFEPCCQLCGQYVETAAYDASGSYMHLCPDCAGRMRQDRTFSEQQKKNKNENLIGGIVGAFLGSLLGVLCIVVCGQLGRVAAISGVILAVCTIKGYEMLGGKLTKKGVFISVIMMLVMTYVGNQIDWGLLIVREFEVDIFTGVRYVPVLLNEGVIESSVYWMNLIMLYAFMLLGAIPTVRSTVKEKAQENYFAQIGSGR
ncbi:MAG: hypothetical protein NC434_14085 [Ruminococcus sp.]|nr:hypothetical protein [Ruminococcus sp.]